MLSFSKFEKKLNQAMPSFNSVLIECVQQATQGFGSPPQLFTKLFMKNSLLSQARRIYVANILFAWKRTCFRFYSLFCRLLWCEPFVFFFFLQKKSCRRCDDLLLTVDRRLLPGSQPSNPNVRFLDSDIKGSKFKF